MKLLRLYPFISFPYSFAELNGDYINNRAPRVKIFPPVKGFLLGRSGGSISEVKIY